ADGAAEADTEQRGGGGGGDPGQGQGPFCERPDAAERAAGDGERQEQAGEEGADDGEAALCGCEERVAQPLADAPALAQAQTIAPATQEEVAGVVREQEDGDG